MAFHKFVNMARSPEEKAEKFAENTYAGPMQVPDYPPGLCFSLDETDLEKLDLDDNVEVGDLIDMRVMARVTSVSKRQVNGMDQCRIELQGEDVAIEDENTEDDLGGA